MVLDSIVNPVAEVPSDGPHIQTAIFLQDACYLHRYIRSRDTSAIVERPERLRSIILGLATTVARLEEISQSSNEANSSGTADPDQLTAAFGRMDLSTGPSTPFQSFVSIVRSSASVDILNHPAVKFIHGDVDGNIYLENLRNWAKNSEEKISQGGSEIPDGLSQGDLYLCPTSMDAMQGAIGTACEAVDTVMKPSLSGDQVNETSPIRRAFVAVRPPGHHCGEDTPSGFCFLNNVAVAAAHAHLQHGIQRIAIFDIDLHHGNGTQSIVWQINEETYRQALESEGGGPLRRGPQIYYGSIHDIQSYPCEDGKPELVQAASVSIHKAHGQHIENVHLQTYTSEEHFWNTLYKERYSKVLRMAEQFFDSTGGSGEDVLVFISCGFDASEHEYTSMSRHNHKVPTSFFHRFAVDAAAIADRYAQGRVVSILEGGYSDRALTSGALAHLCGIADVNKLRGKIDESWWSVENLQKLERASKKFRSEKYSFAATDSPEPWLERALTIFSSLDASAKMIPSPSRGAVSVPPSTMTLRERRKPSRGTEPSPASSPHTIGDKTKTALKVVSKEKVIAPKGNLQSANLPDYSQDSDSSLSSISSQSAAGSSEPAALAPPKLPRVILKLGPPPNPSL